MQGLLYGVRPERWTPPDPENHLLVGLSRVPMRMEELDQPVPTRPGWVMAKTRLTGICGSDAKQVFGDFGDDYTDSALNGHFTFPTVLGHEVVADDRRGGRRRDQPRGGPAGGPQPVAVLRAPGHRPTLWRLPGRRLQPVLALHRRAPGRRDPHRHVARTRPVGSPSTCRPMSPCGSPSRTASATRWPCWATPSPCPSTRSPAIRRRPEERSSSTAAVPWGRRPRPSCGPSIPTSRSWWWPASRPRPPWPGAWGRRSSIPTRSSNCSKTAAAWSGGVLQRVDGALPMAHPGGIDVVYDTVGTGETARSWRAPPQGSRHHGQERCPRPRTLGVVTPVLQGDLLGRVQCLRRRGGGRRAASTALPTTSGWWKTGGST